MDETAKVDRSTLLAEERTEMAAERTLIAADRTLMAWIRTSLSMITFGFTLYKFLQAMRAAEQYTGGRPNAPRNLGMALIGVGTVALAVAIVQNIQFVKRLKGAQPRSPWTLAVIVGIFIALIGLLAFVGVWLRTGPF
ncbi:MAG: DUF202 domain-containing protein [Acidobacteriota bacterium]